MRSFLPASTPQSKQTLGPLNLIQSLNYEGGPATPTIQTALWGQVGGWLILGVKYLNMLYKLYNIYKGDKMQNKGMVYRIKTISISPDQEKWIRENHINLSRFVQDMIDKEIEKKKR